jgi:hypothetical protein
MIINNTTIEIKLKFQNEKSLLFVNFLHAFEVNLILVHKNLKFEKQTLKIIRKMSPKILMFLCSDLKNFIQAVLYTTI